MKRNTKRRKNQAGKRRKWMVLIAALVIACGLFAARGASTENAAAPAAIAVSNVTTSSVSRSVRKALAEVPAYSGTPYAVVNDNEPFFKDSDLTTEVFEDYSSLDSLGRCGTAYADVCEETMPTEKRGKIGSVKPTGWHTVKYSNVDGKYLYNRCHLIGYQLSAENANEENLITGTRYLNVDGMLPFENMVADYIKETDHHVLYRVTPIFEGDNLLASGVLMEAESVEDDGEGIKFCVYCYNVEPGIAIDYEDGSSHLDKTQSSSASGQKTQSSSASGQKSQSSDKSTEDSIMVWVSGSGKKYHSIPDCGSMDPDKAKQETEQQAISQGLAKCGKCW